MFAQVGNTCDRSSHWNRMYTCTKAVSSLPLPHPYYCPHQPDTPISDSIMDVETTLL